MRKLLSSNFSRLWKSKLFWILEAMAFLFGAFMYAVVKSNIQNMGTGWLLSKANYYFFFIILYVAVLTAVFSSIFLGTEYSDGTLRNKLTVGHCRRDVYISNWILIVAVTVSFILTHFLAAVIIGIPAGGIAVLTAVDHMASKLACSLLIALAYASVFTMTSMMDTSKARCAVVNMVLAVALIVAGFMAYSALMQPELTFRMVKQPDGSYIQEHGIPNPRYVSGNSRTILSIAEAFLPSSLALRVAMGTFSIPGVIGTSALTIFLIAVGIILFKKKDIK